MDGFGDDGFHGINALPEAEVDLTAP